MQVQRTSNRLILGLAAMVALAFSAKASAQSVVITPAQSIQAHVNSGLYDEIILSPGTYFQLVDLGGAAITLRSTDPLDPAVVAATIIDGQFQGDSVIKCVTGEGPDTVLDGLTVLNGEALNVGGSDRGGGLYINFASPTVRHCVFEDNQASGYGGAIYANVSASTFDDCVLRSNTATNGGGIYFNSSNAIFTRVRFELNTSPNNGGGAQIASGSVQFIDCTFDQNHADNDGGGVFASNATTTVERCVCQDNTSNRGGGVMTVGTGSAVYRNSIFLGNAATGFGGGIYASSVTDVVNCSFTLNTAGTSGGALIADTGGADTDIVSSILWNNTPSPPSGTGTPLATYCLIEGGFAGAGNIDVDPMFANVIGGDLSLLPGSPAIDAGYSPAVVGQYPVDFLGLPRATDEPVVPDTGVASLGLNVDMGAYEVQVAPVVSCPGDVDGDSMVSVTDLLILLGAWGSCP